FSNKTQNFRILSSGLLEFSALVPSSEPAEYTFKAGDHHVKIIAVNNQLAKRTWFVESKDQTNIVIGPSYIGEAKIKRQHLRLTAERSYQDSTDFPVWIFKPSGDAVQLVKYNKNAGERITKLKIGAWQVKNASEAVSPEYNDHTWLLSDEPLQMGADGDISANAWYRTNLSVPETGKYQLQFKNIRERASVFLDGKWINNASIFKKSIDIDLKAGKKHHLTVFTAHDGRNKQIFYVGPLDTVDAKGLTGPVTLKKSDGTGSVIHITQWRMKGGPGNPDNKRGWKTLSSEPQVNSPHFFKTKFSLPALKGTRPVWRVNTTSLSYGSVWVNGHNLGRYPEKIKINGLYIPENWLKVRNNTIVIYDENGVSPERVSIESEIAAGRDVTIYTENDRLK
ncbi:MAG TPA: hypothetical protein VGD22_17360, partial [Sphingobacteriaceae bacterium]